MIAETTHSVPRANRRVRWIAALIAAAFVWTAGDGRTCRAAEAGNYQGPATLVASRDGKFLYAACADAREVVWVELPAGRVSRRVPVPGEPTGLALTPDGKKLIVACAAPKSTALVLDAATGKQIAAIPAGHTATSPVVSPDGRRLYLCNRFSDDVSVIDLVAGKELARIEAVREPIAADITPDGHTLLVANHLPDVRTDADSEADVSPVVTVVDTRSLATSSIELSHGANGLRGLCVLPDGKHALVTHLMANFDMTPFRVDMGWINTNVVSIIDIPGREVESTIGMDELDRGAGNPWDVICSGDGKTVCVSLAGTHELSILERTELLGEYARRTMQPMMAVWPIYTSLGESLWRRIPLPGKGPRGLATVGSKVYAAQYFSDTVVEVDLAAGDEPAVRTIPLGPPPQLTPQRRGELLFCDATICYQHWQSCNSCHSDGRTDGLVWDLMNDGFGNPKSTKSLLLSHRTPPSMITGVRKSAEVAVRSGMSHILYSERPEPEAEAVDAYLKSLRPVASPHLVDGHLSEAAQRGRKLFENKRIGCAMCHPGPLYTDLKAHNVGSQTKRDIVDRFDTPTLVEVWRTAPYLHDGRYATIKQLFVEGRHGLGGDRLDRLGKQDIDDLVEFVLSL